MDPVKSLKHPFQTPGGSDHGSNQDETFGEKMRRRRDTAGPGFAKANARPPVKLSVNWVILRRFYRVAIAFFRGNAKWKARRLGALMLVLCGVSTGLFVVISYIQRDFSTAMSEKNEKAFYSAIWQFIGIIVIATPLFAIYDYVQGLLALEWRIWLTEQMLSKYFANRAYFDIKMEGKLDNPDQRMAEDVRDFTASTVSIIIVITGKILNVGAFSRVLWSIAPELVYFLLGYSIVCVYLSLRVFGRKLMTLHFEGLQREADFRYSLVRVRDNAESIAFYRGEEREAASTWSFFGRLEVILRERLVWLRHLSLFQNLYDYATIIIPSVIIAPRYFAGKVEFGVIMQTGYAFRTILYALTFIIQRFNELSGLAAQTDRLDSLITTLGDLAPGTAKPPAGGSAKRAWSRLGRSTIEKSKPQGAKGPSAASDQEAEGTPLLRLGRDPQEDSVSGGMASTGSPAGPGKGSGAGIPGKIGREEGPGLVLRDLAITTPNLRTILFPEGLNLSLSPGESLLVMGPSGCGKSSLLRAIAGLWSSGRGVISAPPSSSTFFLPQKPYMPLGSLRTQLLFPSDEERSQHLSDSDLLEALDLVSLRDLNETVGGLDVERDWSDMLSMGEQQRIAFARLLVQQPKMAFLDEASSALDSTNEARLYGLVKERIPSFVSVGHRTSLVKFHSLVLVFDEDEGWKMMKASELETMKRIPSFPT